MVTSTSLNFVMNVQKIYQLFLNNDFALSGDKHEHILSFVCVYS